MVRGHVASVENHALSIDDIDEVGWSRTRGIAPEDHSRLIPRHGSWAELKCSSGRIGEERQIQDGAAPVESHAPNPANGVGIATS
jgi:hypothetical protein